MTGLAVVVLREAGIESKDEGIQKGIAWLKQNQRESGLWWTKSLNTDSGTCYPLLALYKCEALSKSVGAR